MLSRLLIFGTLALPAAAGAEVLSTSVSPFDYSVRRPAPPKEMARKPRGLAHTARYLFEHMDGHGVQAPLAPVDQSQRAPSTLETGTTLVWKWAW